MDLAKAPLVGDMGMNGWSGQSRGPDWILCGLGIPQSLLLGSPPGCCPVSSSKSAVLRRTYLGAQGLSLFCPTFVGLDLLFPLEEALSHCLHSSWEQWLKGQLPSGCGGVG